MYRHVFLIILCFIALQIVACAKSSKQEVPSTSLNNAELALKDSVRVKFKLEIFSNDSKSQKFDAVMFSVPGVRYRLELSGPMGIGVASMLWTDSLWTIVFPTEKKYLKGSGYMVGMLEYADFPLVNVHQIAGFFEQKFLPERYESIDSKDSSGITIVQAVDALGMPFSFAKKDKVLWIKRGGEKAIFNWPEITVLKNEEPYLNITVKKVQRDVSFNASTWRLPVPHGYKKM